MPCYVSKTWRRKKQNLSLGELSGGAAEKAAPEIVEVKNILRRSRVSHHGCARLRRFGGWPGDPHTTTPVKALAPRLPLSTTSGELGTNCCQDIVGSSSLQTRRQGCALAMCLLITELWPVASQSVAAQRCPYDSAGALGVFQGSELIAFQMLRQ